MKIKLNKYINIVRPAPPRRADPEGVHIYILIKKSNIYIYWNSYIIIQKYA